MLISFPLRRSWGGGRGWAEANPAACRALASAKKSFAPRVGEEVKATPFLSCLQPYVGPLFSPTSDKSRPGNVDSVKRDFEEQMLLQN